MAEPAIDKPAIEKPATGTTDPTEAAGPAQPGRVAAGGRAAVVTGGASGIGLACVERLLAAGWQVGILDRDPAGLARARDRFAPQSPVRVAELDVTDEAAAEVVLADMVTAFGRLDGAVNSAGIGADLSVLDTPVELFRKILDVNVIGTFVVGRAVARLMQDGGGAIVNIASVSGLRGSKGRAAYGASKGAVVTLTQVMAVDLARYGIRVNAVAPGPVDTPMVDAVHTPEVRRAWRHYVPMRRYGRADEIAAAVLFLLDDTMSSYVTGEILAVDGGFRGAGMMPIEE
jgi:NAD(P)-dependent dehydrogenase (short-subunit alcohol dehydrogenase family)